MGINIMGITDPLPFKGNGAHRAKHLLHYSFNIVGIFDAMPVQFSDTIRRFIARFTLDMF